MNYKIDMNPLSGLPGNKSIKKQLAESLTNEEFVCVYADIADFKPYNEIYGFSAGDNVIVSLALLLEHICAENNFDKPFIGHIGGDDFFLILHEEETPVFFKELDEKFIELRSSFYREEDVSRGFIIANDRQGQRTNLPLMGICAVSFSSFKQKLSSIEQVSEFAMYLKETAKCMRTEDNVFVNPDQLNMLPVPLKEFVLDNNIILANRRTLIESMGERGLVHFGKVLEELLHEEIHMLLKKSILFSLGRMRYHHAENTIISFTQDKNPHLRMRAVEALGYLGGSRHMKIVAEMLNDNNQYVSAAAIRSLGNIAHSDALEILKEYNTRDTARIALELAVTRAKLGDENASVILEKLLDEKNPYIRIRAARAMSYIKNYRAANILFNTYKKEKLPKVREAIEDSFPTVLNNLNLEQLKLLKNMIWYFYRYTISNKGKFLPVLAKIDPVKVNKIVEKILSSKSSSNKIFAIESMLNYQAKRNIYILRSLLLDVDASVRAKSAEVIGKLGNVDSFEFLRKLLKDPDAGVRKNVSEAIMKIAQEKALQLCGANSVKCQVESIKEKK